MVSSEEITFTILTMKRSAAKTLTISKTNRKRPLQWCRLYKNWTVNQNWKSVIFLDETQVVLGTDGCVCLEENG